MLAIGRALMARPKVLLLDEPSLGLAPVVIDQVFALLQRLRSEAITMLLVEQNVGRALAIADRACVLVHGEITTTAADELARDTDLEALYLEAQA